jgi:hypothetical protein
MRARRGALLPITLVVMLFFALICPIVLGMADMNVKYNSFFEPRSILEQATVSFTHVLFDEISAQQEMVSGGLSGAWLSGGNAKWSGTCIISPDESPPMAFTYTIDESGNNEYELFVKGEFTTLPRIHPVGISVDITTSMDIWRRTQ